MVKPIWSVVLCLVFAPTFSLATSYFDDEAEHLNHVTEETGMLSSMFDMLQDAISVAGDFASVAVTKGTEMVTDVASKGTDFVTDTASKGSELVTDKACDKLLDVVVSFLDGEEAKQFADKVDCRCGMGSGTALELKCDYTEEMCEMVEGSKVCGKPHFLGRYKLGGIFGKANFESTVCFEFRDTEEESEMSKLCVDVAHINEIKRIDELQACDIYAVRKDGTEEYCNKCEICGFKSRSFKYNCAELDFNEKPLSSFYIPYNEQCVGAG